MTEEFKIKRIILEINKPFKLFELYEKLSTCNITNKVIILDVLNSLVDNGLVHCSIDEDGELLFCTDLSV